MRHLLTIALVLYIGLSFTQAQDDRSYSLQEAIDYAINNSPDVRQAQIDIADAEQRVIEMRSIGIPQAKFTSDYTHWIKLPITILPEEFGIDPMTGMPNPNFNNEVAFGVKNNFGANLEVSSLLFDGSYFTGLKAAKFYINQVNQQLKSKQDEIKNNVRDAYLPAIVINENQKILDKNITNLEKMLFETKELYKAGFVEQLDIDRLELSIANLKAEKESLDHQKDLVLNYLKFQMGYPQEQAIDVTDDLKTLLTIPEQEDLEGPVDYNSRSEYAVVQSGITLNELNIQRYKDGYLPQLVAFGSYGVNWQGDTFKDGTWNDNALIGLQLNVPIFDGFQKKAQIERARLQLESVKNRKKILENAIELQVANARVAYKNALQRVDDRKKNVELAQKIYDTTQIKYKEGVGSSLEINQAEQGLYQAQANLINAQYELLVAKLDLDKAIGN